MDKDYVTDQKEENQILRNRVAELEQEISEARKDLTTSLERKIEEVIVQLSPASVWVHRYQPTDTKLLGHRRMRVYHRKTSAHGT